MLQADGAGAGRRAVRVTRPGAGEWGVRSFRIGDFPVPDDMVPTLVGQAMGDPKRSQCAGAGAGRRHVDPRPPERGDPLWSEALMSHRVLIVDDEQGIRQALKQVLEYEDLDVRVAASGGEAITLYTEFRPHLVFLDVKMAGLDGLETLTRLRDLDPRPQIVMISGHGTIATAVEATQRGAFDFLEKPLDTDRLLLTVRNALAHAELVGENARLREAAESRYQMVGSSRGAPAGAATWSARSGRPRPGCSSPARTAPARSWWRGRCTRPLRGGTRRSSR